MSKVDFQALFQSVPDLYIILSSDLTIVAVSDAYAKATMTKREEILGRGLFEIFPDNPQDPAADGVLNLRASLASVLKSRSAHAMPLQKYDIRKPNGSFEARYWSPLNSPVLNEQKEVEYIIHRVEDVTDIVRLQKEQEEKNKVETDLRLCIDEMQVKITKRSLELEKLNAQLEAKVEERTRSLAASEKKYRETLDNMLEGVQIIGFDWRYIYVNKALSKHAKYFKEELIGYTMMQKYPGIENTELFEVLKKCMKERIPQQLETEFLFPDGTSAWFELSIQPVPDGLFILSLEISSRRQAAEKLNRLNEELEQKVRQRTSQLTALNEELQGYIQRVKESEEKYRILFDSIDEGYCIIEMIFDEQQKPVDYRFLVINGAFERQTGLRDAVGRRMREFAPEHEAHWFETYGKIALTGESMRFENRAEQLKRWYDVYAFRFGDPRNMQVAILFNDITERKTTEEQLLAVNKELEAFSYSVSHDLRAPLRAISGFANILRKEYGQKLDGDATRLLGVVQDNAAKMGALIDDLLSFSRLGRKEIQKTTVEMKRLAENACEELNAAGLMNTRIQIGELCPVQADYTLMNQVFINLISNAIKYSSKSESPVVEISSEKVNGEAIYSVKDNGVGFDMKYAHKLFGVFQRLHRVDEFEGTGVGLAIVQRIIHKHGGKTWAQAEPGKGATFYFSLPAN